jgi:DNA-binding MarR family transcriptional regulator
MKRVLPNVARSLMLASRAHTAAVTARLALRGYDDFPFASASLLWLMEQGPDPTDTRAKVVRMTERGEAVKIACVEVREELNRKVARKLGMDEAALLEANLDATAGLFGEIAGMDPQ